MSNFVNQPEFATKFQHISIASNSYPPGDVDFGIAGKFGATKDGVSNGLQKAGVGIYVGKAGVLTFLPQGTASGVAGNYITLNGVQAGSFLPVIANRILIKDFVYTSYKFITRQVR